MDFLLEWFDAYQIDLLLEDCELFLLSEPVTVRELRIPLTSIEAPQKNIGFESVRLE